MQSTKEKAPIPQRTFNISKKTPYEVLVNGHGYFGQRVTEDIIRNVMELVPEIDWAMVLPHIGYMNETRMTRGKSAIARGIAIPIASIAAHMEWNMDSPEIVYMSGFCLLKLLGQRLEELQKRLENASERMFTTEGLKEKALERERSEVSNLGPPRKKLRESLGEFSEQYLPSNPTYLRILEVLPYLGTSMRHSKKDELFELLREGEIAKVAAILKIEN